MKICIKSMAIFLTLCLLLPISVFAQDAILKIEVEQTDTKVTVQVSIENNPGLAAFAIALTYPQEMLTPISCAKGEVLNDGDFTTNFDEDIATNKLSCTYINIKNIDENGILFIAEFNISDNASGTHEIGLEIADGSFISSPEDGVYLDVDYSVITDQVVFKKPSTGGHTDDNSYYPVVPIDPNTSSQPDNVPSIPNQDNNIEPVDNEPQFSDLDGYEWAINEISILKILGVILGTSETTFSPELNVTRADYVLMLVRTMGLSELDTENFADVTPDKYYYEGIRLAKAHNLIAGVGDNRFEPEENITRQDMFVIAYRILLSREKVQIPDENSVLTSFTDNHLISDYAIEALECFVANSLIIGNDSRLDPLSFANRAETAVLISRIIFLQ